MGPAAGLFLRYQEKSLLERTFVKVRISPISFGNCPSMFILQGFHAVHSAGSSDGWLTRHTTTPSRYIYLLMQHQLLHVLSTGLLLIRFLRETHRMHCALRRLTNIACNKRRKSKDRDKNKLASCATKRLSDAHQLMLKRRIVGRSAERSKGHHMTLSCIFDGRRRFSWFMSSA